MAKNQVTCDQPEPLGSAQANKVIKAHRPISSMPEQSPEALVAIERAPTLDRSLLRAQREMPGQEVTQSDGVARERTSKTADPTRPAPQLARTVEGSTRTASAPPPGVASAAASSTPDAVSPGAGGREPCSARAPHSDSVATRLYGTNQWRTRILGSTCTSTAAGLKSNGTRYFGGTCTGWYQS